jgi:hypothetical protein
LQQQLVSSNLLQLQFCYPVWSLVLMTALSIWWEAVPTTQARVRNPCTPHISCTAFLGSLHGSWDHIFPLLVIAR